VLGVEVRRVTERTWCFRRPSYLACSYLVALPDRTVLVDAGMRSDASDAFAALRQAGRAPDTLSAVILTHWHHDHAAGAAELAARTGCRVLHHALDAPWLRGESAPGALRAWAAELTPELGAFVLLKGLLGNAAPRPVASAELVSDGDVVEGALRVLATPGHTPGHVSVLFEDDGVLFAGDALAVVRGEARRMARPVTPDPERAAESMRRLLRLPVDVLCPGHRRPLTGARPSMARLLDEVESGAAWPLLG